MSERDNKLGVRQIWLKDSGHFQRKWGEEKELEKLTEFLQKEASGIDYVKFGPSHLVGRRRERLPAKTEIYRRFSLIPYLDHAYFRDARSENRLEEAIAEVPSLGVAAMEFWNIGEAISPARWKELVTQASRSGVQIIYEFHPAHHFDPAIPPEATTAEDILRAAAPCLEAGATHLMFDHKEFDHLAERAERELPKLVSELGSSRVIFEVETSKHREHLELYFRYLGPDINVANIAPDQVGDVASLRSKTP